MSDSWQPPWGGAINELVYGSRIGPRIGAGVCHSLHNFLARFLRDRNEVAFRYSLRQKIALLTLNRAFLLHGGLFIFRAVVLGIAHEVTRLVFGFVFVVVGFC